MGNIYEHGSSCVPTDLAYRDSGGHTWSTEGDSGQYKTLESGWELGKLQASRAFAYMTTTGSGVFSS